MKLVILAIFSVACASAFENYDGPEWQQVDFSQVTPIHDTPNFWKGTVYEKFAPIPNPHTSRVVGGQEVVPHSHPYQVYLLLQMVVLTTACGGTVISPTVVLTAAHCLTSIRSATVVAGGHNVQIIETNQQRRNAESTAFRIHPDYSRPNVLNDIGTIIVPTAFVFNNFVQPSRLAPANSPNFVGFQSTATGWGRVADGGAVSPVLRYVTNTILPNSVCENFYGNVAINDDTVCIDTAGGRGVCNGDSGGPLTVQSNGLLQIGIASFVHSSGCESGIPHVFERVSSHYNWIQANMR